MGGLDWSELLVDGAVPGLAAAVIRDGRIDQYIGAGRRSVRSGDPVDAHTVFDAASLSKPVFAHLVLQLADRRRLPLEARLGDCVPGYVPGDPRASAITVAQALSHSGGLPNWRNADLLWLARGLNANGRERDDRWLRERAT